MLMQIIYIVIWVSIMNCLVIVVILYAKVFLYVQALIFSLTKIMLKLVIYIITQQLMSLPIMIWLLTILLINVLNFVIALHNVIYFYIWLKMKVITMALNAACFIYLKMLLWMMQYKVTQVVVLLVFRLGTDFINKILN